MKKKSDTSLRLHKVSFILNGKKISCEVKSSDVLLDVIRDQFELKGTKSGCNEGECGACTVLVNGTPVNSCLFLAVNAEGKKITTIEGLTKENGSLDPVQESLVHQGAVQCGFCTSGMAMSLKGMINQYEKHQGLPGSSYSENPSRDEMKKWLEGNLCRCTGYVKIIDAAEKLFHSKEK